MKVLVVGSGGREHAIAWKLKQSAEVSSLFCAPGNAGTAAIAENIDIAADDIEGLTSWAIEANIDLTVVGPEAPLALGLVNRFEEKNLVIFGPTKEAAQLESSKSFAKEIMQASGVPTADSETFEDAADAITYIKERGAPIVIKADGLAAGKGVTVAMTVEQAISAVEECLTSERFGSSGSRVLIEDFIDGREASVMAIVEGTVIKPLVISQDYKRLENLDAGPNTGGMGAISPTPVLSEERLPEIVDEVFTPVISELASRGISYRGFLYAGLIIDSTGQYKVLEFNCRLGDPETQVLLPRLDSDLFEALFSASTSKLSSVQLEWSKRSAACIVASSKGYPAKAEDGKAISGIFGEREDQIVFQAGTKLSEEGISSKGGRILVVTGLGSSLKDALERAYAGMSEIHFDGMHFRTDIGASQPATKSK